MEISKKLLLPYFEKLKNEFDALSREISLRGEAVEILPLSVMTSRKLNQIDSLVSDLEGQEESSLEGPAGYYDSFRQLKFDLRVARRKWMLILSNEARIQKMKERKNHVTTCAA